MVRRREWCDRLKNKTAFGQSCSTMISDAGWLTKAKNGTIIDIQPQLQKEILEGFCKFYCKQRHKRQYVDIAGGVAWKLCADRNNGCFVLTDKSGIALTNSSGIEITVSKKCPALNKEAEIKEACRGSIHYEQILSFKVGDDTEVDHCNDGGFKNIYCKWRATIPESTDQLYEKVVKNDILNTETTKIGYQTFKEPILTQWNYQTFKEPILTQWKTFHLKNAKLQEISKEEHLHITKKRRLIKET